MFYPFYIDMSILSISSIFVDFLSISCKLIFQASQTLPNSVVKVEESAAPAAKKSAISRIFQVKNSKQVKAEVKSEAEPDVSPSSASETATSILKRLDGRPILMCKIPISSIRSSKKRERKTSQSLSGNNTIHNFMRVSSHNLWIKTKLKIFL